MTCSDQLWNGLQRVRAVGFVSHGSSATGWSGTGSGIVTIESPSPAILVFRESGIWHPAGGRDLHFRNVYRWSRVARSVRLEHLRFGEDQPIYLFDLVPDVNGTWSSATPHLCREDAYSARLRQEPNVIVLEWTIAGPEKQENIAYHYSPEQGA